MTSYEAGYRDALSSLVKKAYDSSAAAMLKRHDVLSKQQAAGNVPDVMQKAEAPVFDEIKNNDSGFPDLTALNARQYAPDYPSEVNRDAAELVSPERFAKMTGANTANPDSEAKKTKLDRLFDVLSMQIAKKYGK